MEGPLAVGGAEAADEVVFECLDGAFGRIHTVIGWFDKLPPAIFLFEVGLERCCCLVVGDIQSWFESTVR